jgi:hypothetical protein
MAAVKWREFKTRVEADTFRNGVAWANVLDIILRPVREYAGKFYVIMKDMSSSTEDFPPLPWEETLERCHTARGMCEVISEVYHILDYVNNVGDFCTPGYDRQDSIAKFIALIVTDVYDVHPDMVELRGKRLYTAAIPEVCDQLISLLQRGVADILGVIDRLTTIKDTACKNEAKEGS